MLNLATILIFYKEKYKIIQKQSFCVFSFVCLCIWRTWFHLRLDLSLTCSSMISAILLFCTILLFCLFFFFSYLYMFIYFSSQREKQDLVLLPWTPSRLMKVMKQLPACLQNSGGGLRNC